MKIKQNLINIWNRYKDYKPSEKRKYWSNFVLVLLCGGIFLSIGILLTRLDNDADVISQFKSGWASGLFCGIGGAMIYFSLVDLLIRVIDKIRKKRPSIA